MEPEERDPVSVINEPPLPDNVHSIGRAERAQRSLHVVIAESLNSSRALLNRLEAGVRAPPSEAREVVRLLYVATKNQVRALAAALEQDVE